LQIGSTQTAMTVDQKKSKQQQQFFDIWLKNSKRTIENTDFPTVLDKFDFYLLDIVEYRPANGRKSCPDHF
jgi:hypothetical protein